MTTVVPFTNVYINATGAFLPGPPVGNDRIDDYIAPLNGHSARMRRRILSENGIRTRHYAIDTQGRTRWSAAAMGAEAVRDCLNGDDPASIGLLTSGTSGGDVMLPGFANELQAELGWRALATASHHGVCASGMQALANAARTIERGEYERAMVVASELPSRLFKHSRFDGNGDRADFNAHFLRWMLSDGAGAWLLDSSALKDRPGLRLHWVHTISHSGDFPVCMQMGAPGTGARASWLDYPRAGEAEADGALYLRQDIRLLPHLFDIGSHEYLALAGAGAFDPARIDHFLCHYSSARFRGVVAECLQRTGRIIPEAHWYNNLETRGNTGAASIFIMLHDFLRERRPRAGEQILLFVPESGRFTVSFALLEVVKTSPRPCRPAMLDRHPGTTPARHGRPTKVPPPHDPEDTANPALADLLTRLAAVWHDYRARAWHTPMVRKILDGSFTREDYLNWMEHWIPQVRQGSGWMRAAATGLSERYATLRSTIETHADEEQEDYNILFDDYRKAGGQITDIDALQRNPGGAALHAYLSARARRPDAVELLGAIYIIEGTGQRIIPALLPLIRKRLFGLGAVFRFLHYHGENDIAHLKRWLDAVESVLHDTSDADKTADAIVNCAHNTAELYLMQLAEVTTA